MSSKDQDLGKGADLILKLGSLLHENMTLENKILDFSEPHFPGV